MTHPLVLGVLLGLLIIGPDHVGTLMALSTLASGYDSFKRGFCWGVGHSIGVVSLCPIFLALQHVTSHAVSHEAWRHYGDIFIGTSLIALGIYFIYYKDTYLQKNADGTYIAKGCECHGISPSPGTTADSMPAGSAVCMPCSPSATAPSQQTPSRSDTIRSNSIYVWNLVRNSLMGVLQGLCCPVGMTAGTGIISRVTATASTPMLAAFVFEFALASGVCAGIIALGWGMLTMTGSRSYISGRILYLATCTMLSLLGIVWLVAEHFGVLDRIDIGVNIPETLTPISA